MKRLLCRLTSLLLAMAMVMSLAFTAAAADLSSDSSEDASVSTQQEAEPILDAEDLSSVINETEEMKEEVSDEQQKEENSEETVSAEEESAPAEEESADVENVPGQEQQSEEAVEEADESTAEETEMEAQDATVAGWAAETVGEEVHFTLAYRTAGTADDSSLIQAKDALVALPAQENLSLNGVTYTFSAGVYQFDANGYMVESTTSTSGDQAVSVVALENNALTALTQAPEQRFVYFTSSQVGKVDNAGVITLTPFAKLYNGFLREQEGGVLYGFTDGVKSPYNGRMEIKADKEAYLVGMQPSDAFDKKWYFQGQLYTGYFRSDDAVDPTAVYKINEGSAGALNGCLAANDVYDTFIDNYEVHNELINSKWHVKGHVFTGFFQNASTEVVYLLNDGEIVKNKANGGSTFTGLAKQFTMDGVTYSQFAKLGKEIVDADGLYYELGKPLTGVPGVKPTDNKYPDMYLYKNGKAQKVQDGWYCAPRAEKDFYKPNVYYYFKGNKALTGEYKKLPAIKNGKYKDSHSYYYYFRMNGTLITNLLTYNPTILKTGKFHIHADHTTYTGTILMYNSKTKKYDIPVKSFVVAMSLSKSATASTGTKYGNYPLASGHSSWYHYKSPRTGSWCWYSSSVHIWGSGSMFHSSNYKNFKSSANQNTRRHKMTAHIYNQIGTAVTQHCVRAQTINIRLITQMYRSSSKFKNHGRSCTRNVRVYLSKSTTNNYMPFGRMTMLNNNDLNGYILQNADGYGYGKDCAFDPTDHKCIGETIYICKKKTSKMAECTKIKMTKAYQYQLTYDKA